MLYTQIPSGYRKQSEIGVSQALSLRQEAADDVAAVANALMTADKIAEARLQLCLDDEGITALEEFRAELDDLVGRVLARAEKLREG